MLPLSHHIFRPSLVSANILIVKTTTSSAFWTFNILSQVQWILLVFPAVFLEIFLYHTYCNSYTLTCVKIFLTIQLFEVFPIHIFAVYALSVWYESVSRVCAHFKKIKEKNYWRNWSWQAPTVACQYELENFHLIHFWSSSKDEPGTVHKRRPQSDEGSNFCK